MRTGDTTLLAAFRRAVRARIERDLAQEEALGRALRAEVAPALRAAVAGARAEGRVGRAWLFGSFTGTPREESDVDVMVEGPHGEPISEPLRLAAELGRAVRRPVHLIDRADAAPSLLERVTREGVEL